MSQLADLALPFPPHYVHTNPSGGGSYVAHHIVTQRLLMVVGPFDFELVQIVRGDVPGRAPNPKAQSTRGKEGVPALTGAVVGVVGRLRCQIDGRVVVVEEAGDCEDPHNWPHDGARMKDAMSDALKRAAMRVGLGLHLWSQADYFLHGKLSEGSGGGESMGESAVRPQPTEAASPPAGSHVEAQPLPIGDVPSDAGENGGNGEGVPDGGEGRNSGRATSPVSEAREALKAARK